MGGNSAGIYDDRQYVPTGDPPTDLLEGMQGYYRFHQFSGSQVGGTDSSYGYSDSPSRLATGNQGQTLGLPTASSPEFPGAYPTVIVAGKSARHFPPHSFNVKRQWR